MTSARDRVFLGGQHIRERLGCTGVCLPCCVCCAARYLPCCAFQCIPSIRSRVCQNVVMAASFGFLLASDDVH